MRCTPELLERVQRAIESVAYGAVRITINEKGDYTEVSTERKDRVYKDLESPKPYHAG